MDVYIHVPAEIHSSKSFPSFRIYHVELSGTVVAFGTNPSMEKIPTDGNPKGRNLRDRYFKSFC